MAMAMGMTVTMEEAAFQQKWLHVASSISSGEM